MSFLKWKEFDTVGIFKVFFKYCADKLQFCGATGSLCFWLRMTLPMGFTSRVDDEMKILKPNFCFHKTFINIHRINNFTWGMLELFELKTIVQNFFEGFWFKNIIAKNP